MSSFHVRHDFNPTVAREALLLLRLLGCTTENEFLVQARDRDFEIGQRQSAAKVFASLHDLGLLLRPAGTRTKQVTLTRLGICIADIALYDDLLFAELIHLRYYNLWSPEHAGQEFSWAYQMVANRLWDDAPTQINQNHLVAHVLAMATQEFGVTGISFSSSSVLGILQWLRALRPACIINDTFHRRLLCPPEALISALAGLHSNAGHRFDVPLQLDANMRERACRILLLDPTAFDDVLVQATDTLNILHRHGHGGEMLLLDRPLIPGLVAGED
jgi:hypothetical protein